MSNTERWRNLGLSGVPILGNYINFNGENMDINRTIQESETKLDLVLELIDILEKERYSESFKENHQGILKRCMQFIKLIKQSQHTFNKEKI